MMRYYRYKTCKINWNGKHRPTPLTPTYPSVPTMKGTSPLLLSSCMACFNVSPLRDKCSSVGRNLIFTREINPAFSTEEWAYEHSSTPHQFDFIRLIGSYCTTSGNIDLI